MTDTPSPTLKEVQTVVDRWIHDYGVRYFSPLTNMAQLTEEVGEVARIIARTYGDQSAKSTDNPSPRIIWQTNSLMYSGSSPALLIRPVAI